MPKLATAQNAQVIAGGNVPNQIGAKPSHREMSIPPITVKPGYIMSSRRPAVIDWPEVSMSAPLMNTKTLINKKKKAGTQANPSIKMSIILPPGKKHY